MEILTFDGFGYRSYNQGEQRVIYYQKSDYLDGYAGEYGTSADKIRLVISSDGCITRYNKNANNSENWGAYTYAAVFKGDTLTLKGADGSVIKFYRSEDGTLAGATYNDEYDLKKQ